MTTTTVVVKKRITSLFLILGLVLTGLALRLGWIQIVRGSELQQRALNNRMRDVPVEAKRGIIYDRNGRELAISISSDALYAIPAEVKHSQKDKYIAQKLAEILEMDEQKIWEKITRNSRHEWIKLKVPPNQVQQIKALNLPGIGFAEKSQRFYPKDSLAAHVLGISGADNTGLEGIDKWYDKELGGIPGRIVIEHDAMGRQIPEAIHKYIPPEDGHNIVLTIDETIQYIVERELDKIVAARQPKSATIIVMDPKTGEVLAMGNRPTYNPNNYNDFPAANRRNIAISNSYEPGSTFKIVTAAAALEEGVVRPDDRFYDPGYIKVGKETIGCAQNRAHGSQSFREVVYNSCNVGFVAVGLRLGLDKFYKYVRAFNFGEKTGIDLPGEAAGILVPQARAKQIDLAVMSFGQANAVTPLQMISAISAIANDGLYMKPHLVRAIYNKEGKLIREVQPEPVRQVISKETAQELRMILEGVVRDGTGKNAYVEGYRVAGKTGTAQKIAPGGGYLANEYVASFIGFAPADNPRIAALVVIDAPKGYPYYGGWVAAPVFKELVCDTLRYLQVPAQGESGQGSVGEPAQKLVSVPNVINLSLDEAVGMLTKVGLTAIVEGEGQRVWGQTPLSGAEVAPKTSVLLYLGPVRGEAVMPQNVTVPDVTGKTMREAAQILGAIGLRLDARGTGMATRQHIEPGTVVKTGSIVTVEFQPPSGQRQ
ncbi:MAG: stage V sporulation protein D [Firmicutes bacterium]|nr:stage V sporulation protein D [Bacillota bacterium]